MPSIHWGDKDIFIGGAEPQDRYLIAESYTKCITRLNNNYDIAENVNDKERMNDINRFLNTYSLVPVVRDTELNRSNSFLLYKFVKAAVQKQEAQERIFAERDAQYPIRRFHANMFLYTHPAVEMLIITRAIELHQDNLIERKLVPETNKIRYNPEFFSGNNLRPEDKDLSYDEAKKRTRVNYYIEKPNRVNYVSNIGIPFDGNAVFVGSSVFERSREPNHSTAFDVASVLDSGSKYNSGYYYGSENDEMTEGFVHYRKEEYARTSPPFMVHDRVSECAHVFLYYNIESEFAIYNVLRRAYLEFILHVSGYTQGFFYRMKFIPCNWQCVVVPYDSVNEPFLNVLDKKIKRYLQYSKSTGKIGNVNVSSINLDDPKSVSKTLESFERYCTTSNNSSCTLM